MHRLHLQPGRRKELNPFYGLPLYPSSSNPYTVGQHLPEVAPGGDNGEDVSRIDKALKDCTHPANVLGLNNNRDARQGNHRVSGRADSPQVNVEKLVKPRRDPVNGKE